MLSPCGLALTTFAPQRENRRVHQNFDRCLFVVRHFDDAACADDRFE